VSLAAWLNAWGAAWAAFMVGALVDASVLLGGLLLIWLPLRRRMSAQLAHGLFLLVLLKLALPVSLAGPLTGWLHLEPAPAPIGLVAPAAALEFPTTGDLEVSGADEPLAAPRRIAVRPMTPAPAPAPPFGAAVSAATPAEGAGAGLPLSIEAVLMLGWAAGVLVLVARLGLGLWSTRRLIRQAEALVPACLPVDLEALRRAAGVRGPVRWATSGRLRSPAVGGLVRPTVVLPPDLGDDLTPKQLNWVLLHELAHIRRLDLWVVVAQRFVQALFFFHPAVYVANWIIDQLREYACDDAALASCQSSRRDCGEGFLVIVGRHVERPVPVPEAVSMSPSLGLFESRMFIRRRLVRILDPRRKVHGRLSPLSAVSLLAVSLLVLPAGWGRGAAARLLLPGEARPIATATARVALPLPGDDDEPTNYRPGGILFRRTEASPAAGPEPGPGARSGVLALGYSPDGATLATAGEDTVVNLRDAVDGQVRARLVGHRDTVACLAYSPDGRTIATGGYDKTVRLWDAASGRARAVLEGHSNWVVAVAFAPDGRRVASAGYDKTVRLWDAASGRALATLAGHTAAVRCLAFAPAGTGPLLASGGADQVAIVWDLRSRQARRTLAGHLGTIRALGFSPDGAILATAGEDFEVKLWDVAGGRARVTLAGHSDMVNALTFSPGGRTLATGSLDATVKLWDLRTFRERATLQGHADGVSALAFAPGGRRLATGSYDGSVRLWEPAAPIFAPTACFAAPDAAHRVAFAPDGGAVLALGQDRDRADVLARWDARTGAVLPLSASTTTTRAPDAAPAPVLPSEGCRTWAVAPDGRVLAAGMADGDIVLWDARSGRHLADLKGHRRPLTTIAFAPDGRSLATLDEDRAVKLWSLDARRLTARATLKGDPVCLWSLAYSPDGTTLAVADGPANGPGAVTLWDAAARRVRATLEGHRRGVAAVAYAPDGATIASADWSGVVRIWDAVSGAARDAFAGPQNVARLVFSPDSTRLAAAGANRSIVVWDVDSATETARFTATRGRVYGLAFSPDGTLLAAGGGEADASASGSPGGEVTIWDVETKRQVASLAGHTRAVLALAFAPDGATLATSGLDATVRLWDVARGQARLIVGGLPCWAQSLAFSPDGCRLALGGRGDAIVVLHDTVSGAEVARLVGHCGPVRDLVFSPDGRSLATAGADRAIKIWELPPSTPSVSLPAATP
jgi:WD40 repeat protein/beta-lactamase regulating signal transducer with metallopeptidase domain